MGLVGVTPLRPSRDLAIILLCTSAAVFAPSTVRAQIFSPGPLARAHSQLEGDTHCGACHESGRRTSDNSCGSSNCHRDVVATVRRSAGLHGGQYRGQNCGGCHVDHRGAGSSLIRWPGGNREALDHGTVGYPLRGGHSGPGCDDCHRGRNGRHARTYLGTSRTCRSCHEDPHEARFGTNCEGCHSEAAWSRVDMDGFDHSRARFRLRGAHQRVDCAACHGTPARYLGIEHRNCTSCHRQNPHPAVYGNRCEQCHTEAAWTELGAIRENHPGLSLANGHHDVRCEGCHDRGLDAAPSQGSRCVGCHHAVHEAELGRSCEQCHRSIRWAPLNRSIGLRAHSSTPFPLVGAHQQTECSACHVADLPRQRRYRELAFDACSRCHSDPHTGEFAERSGGECAQCHDERGFAPTSFGGAEHASTTFPLEGRHVAVACSGCHGDERPRLSWHIEASRCNDCHENPHGDQFATEMARGGCPQCHAANGWDQPNIDHTTWALTGAHNLLACASCHSPSEADRLTGQGASYRGVPRECAGCHQDGHVGQFRLSEPRRECAVCHETSSFEIRSFDHGGLANYPLVGRHAQTACSGCHPTVDVGQGVRSVRWRLGYRDCRSCHADPHGEGAR